MPKTLKRKPLKKFIPFLVLLLCYHCPLFSQQLPARSPFAPNNFAWNPAMTATEQYWEAGVTHQQEFVGFEQAPQTTNIYGQYPVPKQNFSIGGFLLLDEIEPVRQNTLALTYAYHLDFGPRRRRRRRGPRQEARLSLGMMVMMQQIFINGTNFITRDAGDPLQPLGELNELRPNVGFGLHFASRPTGPNDGSYFYAGAGTTQLLPQDVLFSEAEVTGNLERVRHDNAVIGYRSDGKQLVIEPSLWLNAITSNLLDAQFNLNVERPDAFWGGLSYNFNQTLAVQMGYVLPSGLADGDNLRIGALASFNIGGFGPSRGLGYGFYLAYRAKS